MKKLLTLLLLGLMVGDCVQMVKGVFKGSYWTIYNINADGTYDVKDRTWYLRNVRGSYLSPCSDSSKCK